MDFTIKKTPEISSEDIWKININYKLWQKWEAKMCIMQREDISNAFDIDEARECRMISIEHLRAFLDFNK